MDQRGKYLDVRRAARCGEADENQLRGLSGTQIIAEIPLSADVKGVGL